MPRTLPANIEANKAAQRYAAAFIVEFERRVVGGASVFYRYTSHTAALTYGGFTWAKLGFVLSATVTDADGMQAMEISFDDQLQTIKALALLYDFRDWPVKVWEAWLNADNGVLDVYGLLFGRTDGVDVNEEGGESSAVITCLPDLAPLQHRGPSQDFQPQCRFDHAGAQCQCPCGGANQCDRTYPACISVQHQNSGIRFGGFRHAPTPGERRQWGIGTSVLAPRQFPIVEEQSGIF